MAHKFGQDVNINRGLGFVEMLITFILLNVVVLVILAAYIDNKLSMINKNINRTHTVVVRGR